MVVCDRREKGNHNGTRKSDGRSSARNERAVDDAGGDQGQAAAQFVMLCRRIARSKNVIISKR